MVLLLWCVFGGLLLHMFEANFLTILLKPNYEKAVDTAQDVLDRGLEVIKPPGAESKVEIMKNSPDKITRTLGERTTVCKDWDDCDNLDTGLIPEVIKTGSSVLQVGFVWGKMLNLGKWHRSKDRLGGDISPFGSYYLNKKWSFEEEFNNHMLRFQQVTVSSYYFCKIHFDLLGWIDSY